MNNDKSSSMRQIFIREGHNRLYRVLISDIMYIEAEKDYCKVVTLSNGSFKSRSSMEKLTEILRASGFVRVHRSYIVNIRFINYIEQDMVHMYDAKMPIGVTFKKAFLDSLYIID